MNSEKFSDTIGEVGSKYYEEAATYRRKKHGWVKWAGLAACLALAVAAVLPSAAKQPAATPDTPSVVMSGVHINEMLPMIRDGSKVGYDPSLYDNVTWDNAAIAKYYGSDLTPAYIPDGLVPAEFTHDGVNYRITTDQLPQVEIVKIAASVIYGEAVTIK